eukprot:m.22255 g.22255  ORF g.22255 m.22255 type:complete len:403 (+) comp11225_c0_seq2:133-1341(+)
MDSVPFQVFVDEAANPANPSKRAHRDDPDLPIPNSNSKRKLTSSSALQTLSRAELLERNAAGFKQQPQPAFTDPSLSTTSAISTASSVSTVAIASDNDAPMLPVLPEEQTQPLAPPSVVPFTSEALQASRQTTATPSVDFGHTLNQYQQQILQHLLQFENNFRPRSGYMRKQRDINHEMRTILVDWLVEVALEYKLEPTTLHLTVAYVDRFLSEMAVQRGKLQLVGVTCMLLASKYEEIYPPCIDDFVYITDNTYSKEQVIKMEHVVLKVLQFNMGSCSALTFMDLFLLKVGASDEIGYLAKYLSELCLQDGGAFMEFRASVTAAACVAMALHTAGRPCWPAALNHISATDVSRTQLCVDRLYVAYKASITSEQQSIRDKYTASKYKRIATVPPPATAPILL